MGLVRLQSALRLMRFAAQAMNSVFEPWVQVAASDKQLTRIRRAAGTGKAIEHAQAVGQGGDLVCHSRDGVCDRCREVCGEDTEVRR